MIFAFSFVPIDDPRPPLFHPTSDGEQALNDKKLMCVCLLQQAPEITVYDQVFHQAEGYDMRVHRDDRRHCKGRGLEIYEEVRDTLFKSPE